MSKETFYFSHDYNARMDEKIKKLLQKHGMEGYGIFWAIIEDLYNNANALRTDYDCIAYDLHTQIEKVKSVINDFDLFVIEDNYFYSLSVEKRLNERREKSEKARNLALRRWKKPENPLPDANALPTQCQGNAIKERKGKENKGNNIPPYIPPYGGIGEQEEKRPRKKKEFIPPTVNDVITYFREKGSTDDLARKAYDYYTTGGWKDAKGDPVLNWKQKMLINWIDKQHAGTMHTQAEPPPPGKSPWANMVRNPNYYTDDQYKAELERCESKAKILEQELDFAGAEAWRERARELERKKKRGIITNDPKLEWLPKQ